ncbi:sel1 repeat family protein [Qipengyuania sp. S6317L1]|nr:sel1 repeat family protein [Qipengyuania sp. S6317L1]
MGETMKYEWENDEYNQEVWELMTHIDEGLEKSLCGLREASEAGSTLAAICLSDILFDGRHGASRNIPEAISWARHAAQNGSIEGGFLLAEYLEKTGDFNAAQEEYAKLAKRGYSPAMYRLALDYWAEKGVERDVAKSIEYFSKAINSGHLHAKADFARLKRAGEFGFWSRISGVVDFFALIIPMMVMFLWYPAGQLVRK